MRAVHTPGTRDSYTLLIVKGLWWSVMSLFCPTQSVFRAEASLMVFPESTASPKSTDLSRQGLELRIRQAIDKGSHLGRKGL